MYILTINQPGYLPEAEPLEFDDLTMARRGFCEELERDWDHRYEQAISAFENGEIPSLDEECLRIDGEYLSAHTEASMASPGESLTVGGYVYELTEVESLPTCSVCGRTNVDDGGDHADTYGHYPR